MARSTSSFRRAQRADSDASTAERVRLSYDCMTSLISEMLSWMSSIRTLSAWPSCAVACHVNVKIQGHEKQAMGRGRSEMISINSKDHTPPANVSRDSCDDLKPGTKTRGTQALGA